jgi:ATP-dependent DNA helicase RecG
MPKRTPLDAQSSVTKLTGVGPQTAEKLARMHVNTLQDVLFHLPFRYEDRTRVTDIAHLLPGQSAVVIAQVEYSKVVFGRRRSLVVSLSDGDAFMGLRLFYFNKTQQNSLQKGAWVRCFGEVRRGTSGFEMIHPEYRIFNSEPTGAMEETLTPVYPTVDGLSQIFWRKLSDQALAVGLPLLTELVPSTSASAKLSQIFDAASLADALQMLHRPPQNALLSAMSTADTPAHQRLIVEELLAHHFSFRRARLQRSSERAQALEVNQALHQAFLHGLGFTLTNAQQRVTQELFDDIARHEPSMRLVQGDVGSGKTVVAAAAMLVAVANGKQVALMAPTELLAEQHYRTLSGWFDDLGIEVRFLASRLKASEKQEVLARLAEGALQVVVGTHALIQDSVTFADLSLVVIDEQHRFGVAQRLALRSKAADGCVPHQIAMTATPIPRTLAMTFYADLDVSSIDELPPGRKVVDTVVMPIAAKRDNVIERLRAACKSGRQAYWVCPIIDESEVLEVQAATVVANELEERLQELSIGLVHGRLKSQEKDLVMTAFRDGSLDVLVATTVIEVGVDVPNASLMIIENAERMGLAQLHQLRGRVGRGSEQSFCILLYQTPLSPHAKERLDTLRKTNDGFVIAEKDLEIRGAGEVLGTRQTGSVSFRVADIMRDQHWLPEIEPLATSLQQYAPENVDLLIDRWIGQREDYVNA